MKILQDGAIRKLYEGPYDSGFHPLVQIIDLQPMEGSRYSITVSDGKFSCRCISSPELSSRIQSGDIKLLSVGNLNRYTKSNIKGAICIIVNEFGLLLTPAEREGDPKEIEAGAARGSMRAEPQAMARDMPAAPMRAMSRGDNYTPIKALSTFNTDWTIKARVTKKCDIKEWNNARGAGKLFNVDLMDVMGDEISATFFNQGVDKFFPMLVENHVYTFAKGTVKLANKRFATLQNEYNLSFDKGAEISEVQDDGSIDNIRFALVGLNLLSDLAKRGGQTIVDVCAVVSEIGETSGFTSKKGEPLRKRVLVLVDDTNHSVELTLWNEETDNPALQSGDQPLVLLAKGLKITEYNNLSLATDRNASKLIYNPVGIKDAERMIHWRDTRYSPANQLTALSIRSGASGKPREFRTIKSILEEWTNCTDVSQTGFYTIRGWINYVKNDDTTLLWYSSCMNQDKCKKKMIKEDDMYHCDSCNQSFQNCIFRYIVSMKVCDETDGLWLSIFDKEFTDIVGCTAQDLKEVQDRNEEEFKDKVSNVLNLRFEFAVKATVGDNGMGPRVKYSAMGVSQIDHRKVTKALLQDLETMLSLSG